MATVPGMPFQADVDDDVELLVPEVESVPENDLHRILVDLLAAGLVARFADDNDVAVFSRLAWFPDKNETSIRLDPDVMVIRGRPPGHRTSYQGWKEGGVVPAVIIEVVSDGDSSADYYRRFDRALRYGVAEIVVVEPLMFGGVTVEHLRADGDHYGVVAVSSSADSPMFVDSLGISFAGGAELAVMEDGYRWPTTAEAFRRARTAVERVVNPNGEAARADAEAARADAETARADAEVARADAEVARADAEAARADRLAARLREAGIDPDA